MCSHRLNHLMWSDKEKTFTCQKCGALFASKKLDPVKEEDVFELLEIMNELKH